MATSCHGRQGMASDSRCRSALALSDTCKCDTLCRYSCASPRSSKLAASAECVAAPREKLSTCVTEEISPSDRRYRHDRWQSSSTNDADRLDDAAVHRRYTFPRTSAFDSKSAGSSWSACGRSKAGRTAAAAPVAPDAMSADTLSLAMSSPARTRPCAAPAFARTYSVTSLLKSSAALAPCTATAPGRSATTPAHPMRRWLTMRLSMLRCIVAPWPTSSSAMNA
mmetsp:Transcript_6652/g.21533  ORF Transcript_6652/g.21533 Transcript_6652/m.21533 type:complete len:224 (-) Transcript_6652:814-1485(-)